MKHVQSFRESLTRARAVRKQRGFFSLELSLVLLVAAIAIVASVLLYMDNVRKNSINSNVQLIELIAGNAKSTYGVRNQYGSVTLAVAVQGRMIPEQLRDPGSNKASNLFGGAIGLSPKTASVTNDVLELTWPNTPSDQCTGIVTAVAGSMRKITVGATEVKPLDAPLNISDLTTACEAANSSLVFSIGRS